MKRFRLGRVIVGYMLGVPLLVAVALCVGQFKLVGSIGRWLEARGDALADRIDAWMSA